MYIKSDRLEIESIKAEFSKVCEELSEYININIDQRSTILGNIRAKRSIEFEEDLSKDVEKIIRGFVSKIDKTNKEFEDIDDDIGTKIKKQAYK